MARGKVKQLAFHVALFIGEQDDMKIDWNAVAKVGLPGAIAMFLVYRLAMGFDMFEARLKAVEQQHSDMLTHAARTEDLMGRSYMSNERVLYVLQIMCMQNAKMASERKDCLSDHR